MVIKLFKKGWQFMPKKRNIFCIALIFSTTFYLGLVLFNYYKVVGSLNKPDCSSGVSNSNINKFVSNFDKYIELAEMSDFTYERHGFDYLAAERDCNPDEHFTESSCDFSYTSSFVGGEFIHDRDTGLGYNILKYTNTPISSGVYGPTEKIINVAFKGTDSGIDLIEDIKQFFGIEAAQYQLALEFVRGLASKYPEHDIRLSGHSLGGGIATFVGLSTGLETVAFNSARLSEKTINSINRSNLDDSNITQIRLFTDLISSSWSTDGTKLYGQQYIFPFRLSLVSSHQIKNVVETLNSYKGIGSEDSCEIYYGRNLEG